MKQIQFRLGERLSHANPILITVIGLSLAGLLRTSLTPIWGSGYIFITFYPVIMLSTAIGGWKHGLSATVGSILLAFVLFFDFPETPVGQIIALLVFLSVNLMIISFTEMISLNRRLAEAEAAAAIRREAVALSELEARRQTDEMLRNSRIAALNLMEDAIEARRKAEQLGEELRDREERMQEALSASRSFTFDWDPQSDRVRRSASCAVILGIDEQHATEDTAQRFFRRIHPEDRERFIAMVNDLKPGNDHYETKYRLIREDGGISVLEESARGFFNASGELLRLIGVCTDVTAREKAEEERQKFVSLADSSQEFVGMCDLEFKPFYVNAAGLKMAGLDNLDAARQVKVQDFFFPEDQQFITEEFFPRVLGEGNGEVEIRFRHFKTGEAIWMLYNVFAIRDTADAAVGWATVSRNIDARRRAEEALHQATERERFLADVIDNADIAFRAGTPDGKLILCNRAFEELTGYSREELLQRDFNLFTDLTPAKWRETDATQQALALRTRQPVRYEKEYLRKDGIIIPVEVFVQPTFSGTDQLLHYRAFVTHISERKQAEAALQQAHDELETRVLTRTAELQQMVKLVQAERQRFKDVLDQLPAYLVLLTKNYKIAFANRFFRERFGEDRGRRCYEYLFDRDSPCEVCETFKVFKESVPQRWEWNGPDGRIYDIYDFPFTDVDGSELIMEIGLDITERRSAEQELEKHHHNLEALVRERTAQLESVNALLQNEIIERKAAEETLRRHEEDLSRAQAVGRIGSWRLDIIHNELSWSDECYRIFGVPQSTQVNYEHFLTIVHPDDRAFVDGAWQAAMYGSPYDIEHRIVVDGKIRWVRERAELEFGPDGQLRGGFGTAQDITERKVAEEALREADRRKDEFLATLAHELRNPLAPLHNNLEILRRRGPLDPEMESLQAMMERQVSQLTRLVDDLLEVSRITRGKIELRPNPVPLETVVRDAVDCVRPYIDAGAHPLSVQLPETPVILFVDAARITQVLSNLLNNAAKFTPKGGSIEVHAEPATSPEGSAGFTLCVRDSGIGIAHEMQEHIFNMFAQAGHRGSGLGIGLTLVRQLVALHGGTVTVHSDGPGLGSEFCIWLPPTCLAETLPATTNATLLAPAAASDRRILVVDDNRDAADSLAALLDVLGWHVKQVYNGPEALQAVSAWRPQLVFLDIGMAGMDGCEVAQRIRANPDNAAIILVALTGWGQEDMREKTHNAGFNHHLVKPMDFSLLEMLLANLDSTVKNADVEA